MNLIEIEIAGNTIGRWIFSAGIAALCFAGLLLIRKLFSRRLEKLAAKTITTLDDLVVELIHHTHALFLAVLSVGEYLGTVEHIGLKTTRIRSLSGEQIIFSNNDLLQSRVQNFKRMYERRVVFTFSVAYETHVDQLQKISSIVRSIIESKKKTRFDRVHFFLYGESGLIYEAVYYVLDPDYNIYMDIHESINLDIHRTFAEEGIVFAYPTRTVLIKNAGAVSASDRGSAVAAS